MGRRGLGRGLDALIGTEESDFERDSLELDIGLVQPRGRQPRKKFEDESMAELAASIREHGVLQPIVVRPVEAGKYEVVAGERRLRAAGMGGLERIPVVIREIGEHEASELALIENLQREDLSPVEEALAFREMIEQYGYTQEKLAERIGKSRSYVANALRILNLCSEVRDMVERGELSAGHARAILGVAKDEKEQVKIARRIVRFGLSVRDVEGVKKKETGRHEPRESELVDLEERLQERLGTKASVKRNRRGGRIEIFFYNDEDLMRIVDILNL